MLCMYMGGAITLSESLVGEIEWLKNLNISKRGRLGALICPWSLHLMTPCFIRWMLCMFVRGCIDLVGCPLCGKIEWLKSLSIFEGMLRIFNSSMVIVLDGAHVHLLYVLYVHGRGGALTLSNVPCVGK